MSELRFDMATNDWVVFAPSRRIATQGSCGRVPPVERRRDRAANCPFCPGNEAFTPPEIYAVRSPEQRGCIGLEGARVSEQVSGLANRGESGAFRRRASLLVDGRLRRLTK